MLQFEDEMWKMTFHSKLIQFNWSNKGFLEISYIEQVVYIDVKEIPTNKYTTYNEVTFCERNGSQVWDPPISADRLKRGETPSKKLTTRTSCTYDPVGRAHIMHAPSMFADSRLQLVFAEDAVARGKHVVCFCFSHRVALSKPLLSFFTAMCYFHNTAKDCTRPVVCL